MKLFLLLVLMSSTFFVSEEPYKEGPSAFGKRAEKDADHYFESTVGGKKGTGHAKAPSTTSPRRDPRDPMDDCVVFGNQTWPQAIEAFTSKVNRVRACAEKDLGAIDKGLFKLKGFFVQADPHQFFRPDLENQISAFLIHWARCADFNKKSPITGLAEKMAAFQQVFWKKQAECDGVPYEANTNRSAKKDEPAQQTGGVTPAKGVGQSKGAAAGK